MSKKRKVRSVPKDPHTGDDSVDQAAVKTYESVAAVQDGDGSDEKVQTAANAETERDDGDSAAADALAEIQRKAEQHWEALLRTRAELDNVRKRAAREAENARKYALEQFVRRLIPVRDSLEAGLRHEVAEDAVQTLRQGMEMTLKMFDTMLKDNAIIEIDPLGESFDPAVHEAMTTLASKEHEPNTVVQVLQKGYTLNGRLVRPARVIVAADPG